MKEFVILLLGFTLVTLIACPVQFVAADHLKPGIGIYKDEITLNLIPIRDSKYQIYLQVEVRNAQGQLVGIFEGTEGHLIPHKITDATFNEKMGKIEIITIDNIKYEKALYRGTLDVKQLLSNTSGDMISPHFIGLWTINLCGAVDGHKSKCMAVFQSNTSQVPITEEDVVTNHWTILRAID
jgi:hypothetical protein